MNKEQKFRLLLQLFSQYLNEIIDENKKTAEARVLR